jgi:hypothetical protein
VWQDISTAPSHTFITCMHVSKRWIRFGRYYPEFRKWYYSGTNERSQWAQVEGDEPTHWMPMPEIPKGIEINE